MNPLLTMRRQVDQTPHSLQSLEGQTASPAMSIEMDLDNEDTSGLSSVESEQPEPGPSTRRTSARQKSAANAGAKARASTLANSSKGTRPLRLIPDAAYADCPRS